MPKTTEPTFDASQHTTATRTPATKQNARGRPRKTEAKSALPANLQAAHEARARIAAERSRMSPEELAIADLNEIVNEIAPRLYKGYGSLSNFFARNRGLLTETQMHGACEHIRWCLEQAEQQIDPVSRPPEFDVAKL